MNKIKKILLAGMTCLLVGCGGVSSTTYTYEDSMTIPSDMIGAQEDVDVSGIEEMTLYYNDEKVDKLADTIVYTFDGEVSDEAKENVKGLLLDSFDTEEKGIVVKDISSDKIGVSIEIDLAQVDKDNEILQMFNLNASDFNDDNTYPLNTLENALIQAGYEKYRRLLVSSFFCSWMKMIVFINDFFIINMCIDSCC